jgi:hypothetical protein
MAIDSAERRKSLVGIITSMSPGVTPNASQDVEWRQEAGWGYPGIAAGGAPPADGVQQPGMILLLDMSI